MNISHFYHYLVLSIFYIHVQGYFIMTPSNGTKPDTGKNVTTLRTTATVTTITVTTPKGYRTPRNYTKRTSPSSDSSKNRTGKGFREMQSETEIRKYLELENKNGSRSSNSVDGDKKKLAISRRYQFADETVPLDVCYESTPKCSCELVATATGDLIISNADGHYLRGCFNPEETWNRYGVIYDTETNEVKSCDFDSDCGDILEAYCEFNQPEWMRLTYSEVEGVMYGKGVCKYQGKDSSYLPFRPFSLFENKTLDSSSRLLSINGRNCESHSECDATDTEIASCQGERVKYCYRETVPKSIVDIPQTKQITISVPYTSCYTASDCYEFISNQVCVDQVCYSSKLSGQLTRKMTPSCRLSENQILRFNPEHYCYKDKISHKNTLKTTWRTEQKCFVNADCPLKEQVCVSMGTSGYCWYGPDNKIKVNVGTMIIIFVTVSTIFCGVTLLCFLLHFRLLSEWNPWNVIKYLFSKETKKEKNKDDDDFDVEKKQD